MSTNYEKFIKFALFIVGIVVVGYENRIKFIQACNEVCWNAGIFWVFFFLVNCLINLHKNDLLVSPNKNFPFQNQFTSPEAWTVTILGNTCRDVKPDKILVSNCCFWSNHNRYNFLNKFIGALTALFFINYCVELKSDSEIGQLAVIGYLKSDTYISQLYYVHSA